MKQYPQDEKYKKILLTYRKCYALKVIAYIMMSIKLPLVVTILKRHAVLENETKSIRSKLDIEDRKKWQDRLR